MAEVLDSRPKILEALSKLFVDYYINKGPLEAAKWIQNRIENHEIDRMRHLITQEFLNRGYKFPSKDNCSKT